MPLQRLEENLHQERVWLKSTPKPKKKNLKKRIWWERNLKIKKRALYFGFCHPWMRHPHFILTRFGNSIWFNCRHQGAFPCIIASKPSMAPISTRIYFDPKKKVQELMWNVSRLLYLHLILNSCISYYMTFTQIVFLLGSGSYLEPYRTQTICWNLPTIYCTQFKVQTKENRTHSEPFC